MIRRAGTVVGILIVAAIAGAGVRAEAVGATAVHANLVSVRLFGDAAVRGHVTPRQPGVTVRLELIHHGRVVARASAGSGDRGEFRRRISPVREPGAYRVRATVTGAAKAVSNVRSTPLPSLGEGAHGEYVTLLERRLVQLGYFLRGVDDRYDFRTADAVLAFRKVQRMDRVFTVTPATWRALASPVVLHVHGPTTGYHIEVNQTLQVMFLVNDGVISSIIHVSTGKPSTPTPDGTWHIYEKHHRVIDGMIYPSYYCWRAAFHGYVPVPTYPASHGCIRVPPWTAQWVFEKTPMRALVLIYH